jgi:hypothetical protein
MNILRFYDNSVIYGSHPKRMRLTKVVRPFMALGFETKSKSVGDDTDFRKHCILELKGTARLRRRIIE